MRASKSADQKIARRLRRKIRFATQQIESHGARWCTCIALIPRRLEGSALVNLEAHQCRRDIRKLRSQHIVSANARRAVARVAENARAHRVDYGARVFVICNLIIFLLTFAVMPVACTNSEWSRRHSPFLPTWKSTMICGACHLRADRVDARLLIPAYG